MTTGNERHAPLREAFQRELEILSAGRHNVLVEGPAAESGAVLHLLQPHIDEPIVWDGPDTPLDLPGRVTGALILKGIAGLSADDQTRLLAWLGGTGSRTQVVSTTEHSLFALVARGLFNETLYYRLNILLLRVGSVAFQPH